jgi:hypothetical protein
MVLANPARFTAATTMEKSIALIFAADEKYFHLLDGLLASLELQSVPARFHRCLFDLGLSSAQANAIRRRVDQIVTPDWAIDFPERDNAPRWFRAMVNRPFLPKFFPGFDVYLWLDVDGWLQDGKCLERFVHAASEGDVAIVPERFGPPIAYTRRLPDNRLLVQELSEQTIRANLANCYRDSFGPEYAAHAEGPVRNTGAFAIRADSKAWEAWQEQIRIGLRGGPKHVLVEQMALNIAFITGSATARDLPFICNWNVATNHPVLDVSRPALVDPIDGSLIEFVHLNDAKNYPSMELLTVTGGKTDVPLQFRQFTSQFAR